MFCFIGLGNPGPQYQRTRHNAGFLVIDQIARQTAIKINRRRFNGIYGIGSIGQEEVLLVKPLSYMNLSGQVAASFIADYKIPLDRLLIIYDDMDLPFGTLRIKLSGSGGGHKGLTSIIHSIGANQIPRLRIGIGRPESGEGRGVHDEVIDYVLTPFTSAEETLIPNILVYSAKAAIAFITNGPEFAMNHFNGPVPREKIIGAQA
ncbi:MAG TPA: aminoacyl-tRNA hydrolase [Bacillota bacterium]|nr:aminoacyl-tRNA hydrolase [Bacillota bacterium]